MFQENTSRIPSGTYTDNFVDREWLSIKNDSIPHLKQIQTFAIWDNKWSKKRKKENISF